MYSTYIGSGRTAIMIFSLHRPIVKTIFVHEEIIHCIVEPNQPILNTHVSEKQLAQFKHLSSMEEDVHMMTA